MLVQLQKYQKKDICSGKKTKNYGLAKTDLNIIQIDNKKYYKIFSFLGNTITQPSIEQKTCFR